MGPTPPPRGGGNGSKRPIHPSGRGGGGTPPGSPAVREAPRLRRFDPSPPRASARRPWEF